MLRYHCEVFTIYGCCFMKIFVNALSTPPISGSAGEWVKQTTGNGRHCCKLAISGTVSLHLIMCPILRSQCTSARFDDLRHANAGE